MSNAPDWQIFRLRLANDRLTAMAGYSPDDYFHRATKRWPTIAWSKQAYKAHLGNETPKHPVDLFLGGAAGHRLGEAWIVIEQELGPQTRRILQRQPTADYDLEDLWGDTIIKLMDNAPPPETPPEAPLETSPETRQASPLQTTDSPTLPNDQPPARIIHYRGKVQLLHYLVLIAKRLAIGRQRKSKPSQFLSLVRDDPADAKNPADQIADTRGNAPDIDAQYNETTQNLVKALACAWTDLSAHQRFLIRMVYDRGMKQREAGELLGFSPFKTNRMIKKAMAALQTSLAEVVAKPWSPSLTAVWAGVWADHWKKINNDYDD